MKKLFLLLMFVGICSNFCTAQTTEPPPLFPPNGGDVDDVPPQTQDVPFDGGLAVLLATGASYGLVRLRQSRKD